MISASERTGADGPSHGQVFVQVRLEFVQQNLVLAVANIFRGWAGPPDR